MTLDLAIAELARAVLACSAADRATAREHIKAAAKHAGVQLDVDTPGPGLGAYRLIQEYALVAAKALCSVRAAPALRPDHARDAMERAAAALVSAHECACGRRGG